MSLYQICTPKQDLSDNTGGKIISHGSRVVILAFVGKGKCVVCRYGNYLDSLITDINPLDFGK
jgi:threonine dehydrogenase-like Zn-dependent dehydrogenase